MLMEIHRIDDITPEEELTLEREAVARSAAARSMVAMSSSSSMSREASSSTLGLAIDPMDGNLNMNTAQGLGALAQAPQSRSTTPSNPMFPHALALPSSNALLNSTGTPNPDEQPHGLTSAEDIAFRAQTTEEYMTICRTFIEHLQGGSAPWLLQRLNNTYGTMPDDPNEFSYWMALVSIANERLGGS
jgi:hypothetical protein